MKKAKKQCDQKSCKLCRLTEPSWQPAITAFKQQLQFKRGEPLFTEGEALDGIFYLYEGQVKVHKYWTEGRELIVRFATEGEIVGHRGLGLDTVYPVSATALTPVTACYFPLNFFMDTIRVNHQFANDLLWFFAAELKSSERRMQHMMLLPVKNRLAETLLYLQQKFGTDESGFIKLTSTKTDIAAFTGTTYETTFRMFQDMETEGWIEFSGKQIKILKQSELERLASELD